MAISDLDLMDEIQYAMLEPPDRGFTWVSGLWTKEEVLAYLNQRQHRFLRDTLCLLGFAEILTPANIRRFDLPEDWIATSRVTWHTADHLIHVLPKLDSWEADYGLTGWPNLSVAIPMGYSQGEQPTRQIEVIPASFDNGVLEVLYVALGAPLTGADPDPPNAPDTFVLPDECVPYVKYGTMDDMLRKVGRGQDLPRAAYCHGRFKEGIEVTKLLLEGWA